MIFSLLRSNFIFTDSSVYFLLNPTLSECCVELLVGFINFVSSQPRASLLAANHLFIWNRFNAGSLGWITNSLCTPYNRWPVVCI